jgi:dCTP deaminase
MILTDEDIRRRIDTGDIQFDPPIEPEQVGDSSVDLRLGQILKFPQPDPHRNFRLSGGRIPAELYGKEQAIPQNGYNLPPNQLVLGHTYEKVGLPNDLAGRLEGRSSFARLGLMVHVTSAHIDPGFSGVIVLEMYNLGPNTLVLEPLTPITAIVFSKVSTPLRRRYSGTFAGQIKP